MLGLLSEFLCFLTKFSCLLCEFSCLLNEFSYLLSKFPCLLNLTSLQIRKSLLCRNHKSFQINKTLLCLKLILHCSAVSSIPRDTIFGDFKEQFYLSINLPYIISKNPSIIPLIITLINNIFPKYQYIFSVLFPSSDSPANFRFCFTLQTLF